MVVVLRREVGDVLRTRRQDLGRTLRDVSAQASVSLGYLSEVERGEKEASSELLASICAALELPRGLRINAVSPSVLSEALDAYGDFFPGFEPVTAARAALAYQRSIDGIANGQVFKVWQ